MAFFEFIGSLKNESLELQFEDIKDGMDDSPTSIAASALFR